LFERIGDVRELLVKTLPAVPSSFLIVDVQSQTMLLVENGIEKKKYTISTSRFGVGSREGSNMTPPGVHRIAQKIGNDAPAGRIFKSREDTGIDWQPGMTEENLILTRILRLEGLEPGINNGPGIDSWDRYIYIHGTNREDLIGTPMSHGCICMRNSDVVELFDAVEEGAIVVISDKQ